MTHFLREYAIKLSPRVSATFFLNIIESKLRLRIRIRRNVRAAKKERMGGGELEEGEEEEVENFFPVLSLLCTWAIYLPYPSIII